MKSEQLVKVSLRKPFPNFRAGAQIFAESRPHEVDLYSGKKVLMKKSGEEISKGRYYNDVIKTGLGFLRFTTANFKIMGSGLFRDFLFTFSECPKWAVHENADDKEFVNPTQLAPEFHPSTPLNQSTTMTTFWWGANFLTLLQILKLMETRFPLWYKIYGLQLIEACDRVGDSVLELKNQFSHIYRNVKDTVFPDDLLNRYVHSSVRENSLVVDEVPIDLYSSLVRHDVTIRGLIPVLIDKSSTEFKNIMIEGSLVIPSISIESDNREELRKMKSHYKLKTK